MVLAEGEASPRALILICADLDQISILRVRVSRERTLFGGSGDVSIADNEFVLWRLLLQLRWALSNLNCMTLLRPGDGSPLQPFQCGRTRCDHGHDAARPKRAGDYYDPSNRLTNIQNASGASVIGLGYDIQGNLENKNGQGYSFDYGNRLRHVFGKEAYRYDALGRRVLSMRDDWAVVNRLSMYNKAGQLIYTEAGSPKKALEHFYLGSSVLAIRETDWSGTPGIVRYQHTDALGSPAAVTDAAGAVIERTDWEPYGAAIGKPNYDGVGYTGHVMDGGSGLTYMQQRYYDHNLAVFLSVDPISALNADKSFFNRYRYANNDPFRFIDPDGRSSCADAVCKTSYIDSRPARAPGFSPSVNGDAGLPKGMAGQLIGSASGGPFISFVNDKAGGADPNQPVSTETANMVERAVINSGVNSVNVNSTTGGSHGVASRHYSGRAVDINKINGSRVDSSEGKNLAKSLQNAAKLEGNIRENFGPSFNEKTLSPGGTASDVTSRSVIDGHKNHVHLSGQK